ncbi:MAG: YHS domain-containing protein [Planctomycetota bacterium]
MKKMILWGVLMMPGLWFLMGCSEEKTPVSPSAQPVAPKVTGAEVTVHQIAESEVGQEVACPVMTTSKFKVKKTTPAIDYQGKTYYFCCGDCLELFKKEPAKYISREHNEHKDDKH